MEANAAVYISDTAVDHDTKTALRSGVAKLEVASQNNKDWHPGSDEKVLDVVHPSLFPLMYGTSKFLRDEKVPLESCSEYSGLGEIVPTVDFAKGENSEYSTKHQWLPCDIAVDASGNAKIMSYINNLHPRGHQETYGAIEQIISKAIPIWKVAIRSTVYRYEQSRLTVKGDGWDQDAANADDEAHEERMESRAREGLDDDEDEYFFDYYDEIYIVVPEPAPYKARQRTSTDNAASVFDRAFSGNSLQIIVKLANIHLTPEKPEYDEGSWHIEGLPNEHVCASALYYYDSSNVTGSYLAFRENVNEQYLTKVGPYHLPAGPSYELSRSESIEAIFGLHYEEGIAPATQVLGKVLTREDRLLVFPNVLQRRVSSFKLADNTKPGHRKLLALFLVDPNITIPSTSNIPPQRRDWWAYEIDRNGALKKLPQELADRVYDEVDDFPLSTERAKEVRDDLMEERKAQLEATEQDRREDFHYYNFCEH